MADEILKIDANNKSVAGAVTDDVAQEIRMLRIDDTTKGLKVIIAGGAGIGTVTSVSVVTANGFAGTVATATTTPAITLSTTITGILQGNGTAISAITIGAGLSFAGGTLSATGDTSVTLLDVATNSTTTANSLYTLTSGQDVEFKQSAGNGGKTMMYLVDSSARIGMGTLSPAAKLHVETTNVPQGYFGYDASTTFGISVGSTGATGLSVTGSGPYFYTLNNFNIGTSSSTGKMLHVLNAAGNLAQFSYDLSNYMLLDIGSTGNATFNVVGTSPTFNFSDSMLITGNLNLVNGANRTFKLSNQTVADTRGDDLTIEGASGLGTGVNGDIYIFTTDRTTASVANTMDTGKIEMLAGTLTVQTTDTLEGANVIAGGAALGTNIGEGGFLQLKGGEVTVDDYTDYAELYGGNVVKSGGTLTSGANIGVGAIHGVFGGEYDGGTFTGGYQWFLAGEGDGTAVDGYHMFGIISSAGSPTEWARFTGGKLGIGTGATVSAKLHTISTTEQYRNGYDSGNYMAVTTGSTGSTTFALTGTSPTFSFSQAVSVATSVTTPLLIGGSGTTQTLTYKTTTGVGTTGADHIFVVGNNGGTEAMRILNSGLIGIGTASPAYKLDIIAGSYPQMVIADSKANTTEKYAQLGFGHYTNTEEPVGGFYSASTAGASQISIGGGAGQFNAATQIDFYTAANTTTLVGTSRLQLTTNGNVILGAQAALATNATDGHMYIPTCAGTPTGVPTAYTGKCAMIMDTTGNKLWVYDGGWIGIALA